MASADHLTAQQAVGKCFKNEVLGEYRVLRATRSSKRDFVVYKAPNGEAAHITHLDHVGFDYTFCQMRWSGAYHSQDYTIMKPMLRGLVNGDAPDTPVLDYENSYHWCYRFTHASSSPPHTDTMKQAHLTAMTECAYALEHNIKNLKGAALEMKQGMNDDFKKYTAITQEISKIKHDAIQWRILVSRVAKSSKEDVAISPEKREENLPRIHADERTINDRAFKLATKRLFVEQNSMNIEMDKKSAEAHPIGALEQKVADQAKTIEASASASVMNHELNAIDIQDLRARIQETGVVPTLANHEMAPKQKEEMLEERNRPTITVTKRTNRSLYMFVLQHILSPLHSVLVRPGEPTPAGSQPLTPHKKAIKRCSVTERQTEGIYVYDMVAHQPPATKLSETEKKTQKHMYYFAGGGWQMLPSSEHWSLCAEFACKLPNTTVSLVSYPLAPNSPAPMAIPALMKWYHTALREAEEANETVIFAGDSAGGNIILCLTLCALHEDINARAPAAIMAISPSTDLRRHNPDIKIIEKHDPILRIPFINMTARTWRNAWDPIDVRVSPLYADVSPLAKRGILVHGVVGRYDILGPDAILFREKCNQASVRGEWLDWEKQMHVFPLTWAFRLPEGVGSKNWMVDVLRKT
ncbi:hypothetical protein LTR62_000533 [Meristemomyces frigidus]|uniref:Alpha/beta hydrolase fold-3 domain-containing protein n=1 Tax=Meristemomyces frigidus TaxID=1508187 RepID=A0AAN7YCD4_9PEZI|nr:hypothetical protein LTR62_000533 [Meristemomyces frigidus]